MKSLIDGLLALFLCSVALGAGLEIPHRSDTLRVWARLTESSLPSLTGGGPADILKTFGLSFFISPQAHLFNRLESKQRNDFSRFKGGGLEFAAARKSSLFVEFHYLLGMINLAKAGLPGLSWKRFRAQAMSVQVGVRFFL